MAHDATVLDLINLLEFETTLRFDASMGNANNLILEADFSLIQLDKLRLDQIVDDNSKQAERLRNAKMNVESSLNFALTYQIKDTGAGQDIRIVPDHKQFMVQWLSFFGDFFFKSLTTAIASKNEKDYSTVEKVKKHPETFAALSRLIEQPYDVVERAYQSFTQAAMEYLNVVIEKKITTERFMSMETFVLEYSRNVQGLAQRLQQLKEAGEQL